MKYYEEMLTKWGFSEGVTAPLGIEHYRTAYILAINSLAAAGNSCVRLRAYDRPGMHNWCLILTVPVESVKEMPPPLLAVPDDHYEHVDQDEAMERAISDAMEMGIDAYVTCRITLSKSSIKQLLSLKPTLASV